jgi:hypothetical protein
MTIRNFRRGSVMFEFVLTAIPMVFIVISVQWICMGIWEYHTLAEAINATARIASVHGAGCVGQTCATTVDSTARLLAARAIGIPPANLNVTLTSTGSTVTCNPLSSCYGNMASWPTLSANVAGSTDIGLSATFQFTSPISLWTPRQGGESFNGVTLGANARQAVVY